MAEVTEPMIVQTPPRGATMPESATTGPHDLVISQGDCQFSGKCSCGAHLGVLRPDQSFNDLGVDWERHVMLRHRDCHCEVHLL